MTREYVKQRTNRRLKNIKFEGSDRRKNYGRRLPERRKLIYLKALTYSIISAIIIATIISFYAIRSL